MRRALLVAATVLSLSACATPPPYANAAVPKDQWSRDYAACRRLAEDDVMPAYDPEPGPRTSDPFRIMDRDDAKRRLSGMVHACMSDRGYRRVKPE